MSNKAIKFKNNIYLDTKGIMHNKKILSDKFQEHNMNVSTTITNSKWIKLCNIKLDYHTQGEFIFIKILIGNGNNGRTDQNAYIDLYMQLGWTGSVGGRPGCNAELHSLDSSVTTFNTNLKIIANSNINYDVWFYINQVYCSPNYIANTSKKAIVTPKFELIDGTPTGTECLLSYKMFNKAVCTAACTSRKTINYSTAWTLAKIPLDVIKNTAEVASMSFEISNGGVKVKRAMKALVSARLSTFQSPKSGEFDIHIHRNNLSGDALLDGHSNIVSESTSQHIICPVLVDLNANDILYLNFSSGATGTYRTLYEGISTNITIQEIQ